MRKLVVLLFSLMSALYLSAAISAIPNNNHPTTYLGPILQGSYTDSLTPTTAYSVAGEGGPRNLRLGGTMGWAADSSQRIKVSAEYLVQKITYPFFVGDTSEWVKQAAVGGAYQYDLPAPYMPQFNLSAFFSHAPSKTLSTETGVFVNSAGLSQNFIDMRRIAGSNASGIAPGVSIHPWIGGETGIELNYDNVHYDKKLAPTPSEDAIGFGGTARLKQSITQNISVDLLAAVRQPFNNYQADIALKNLSGLPGWIFDINAAYTVGKNTLPSTWIVGLSADFIMDRAAEPVAISRGKATAFINQLPTAQLTQWVATPAVYLPQVLAIPEENVSFPLNCAPPRLIGTLPNLPDLITDATIQTSQVFAGGPFTFSKIVSPSPAPSSVSINPTSGVITIDTVRDRFATHTFLITVTATNACGSTPTSFFVVVPQDIE